MNVTNFRGRSVVITGGASGIGRATAERFAASGARVTIADVDEASGVDLAADLRAAGHLVEFCRTDISRSRDVEHLMKIVGDASGSLDVLVNNAGVGIFQPLRDTTEEIWDRVLSTNLKGAYLCSYFALPLLRRGSSIVNVASIHGSASRPGVTAYATSKAGIIGLTRQLAVELAPEGIRVTCVAPAVVDTPMFQRTLTSPDDDAERAAWASRQPLNSLIQPEDVAASIMFLASENARMITGSVVAVDGGILARLSS